MSAFDQYGSTAVGIAQEHGLDPSIFLGLIQTESSWNPNATPGTSSAWGFTQLLKGTAKDMGVDAHDPVQNLQGGAKYLSGLLSQFGGDYTKALAAYHDGAGALGQHGGYDYAAKVKANARQYSGLGLGRDFLTSIAGATIGNAVADAFEGAGAGLSAPADAVTGAASKVYDGLSLSSWFGRIALALFAFLLLILGGFMLVEAQKN